MDGIACFAIEKSSATQNWLKMLEKVINPSVSFVTNNNNNNGRNGSCRGWLPH